MNHDIPEAVRKFHYWRGFRSAVLVLLPFVIALAWAANIAIDCLTA